MGCKLMITKELIDRINELANKKKNQGLTPNELAEQQRLYKIYLSSIREQVTTQLEAARANSNKPDDSCTCHCGEHHHHGPDCGHKH